VADVRNEVSIALSVDMELGFRRWLGSDNIGVAGWRGCTTQHLRVNDATHVYFIFLHNDYDLYFVQLLNRMSIMKNRYFTFIALLSRKYCAAIMPFQIANNRFYVNLFPAPSILPAMLYAIYY